MAQAGLPLRKDSYLQSPTLEVVPLAQCCLLGLDAVVIQVMENGWVKAPSS